MAEDTQAEVTRAEDTTVALGYQSAQDAAVDRRVAAITRALKWVGWTLLLVSVLLLAMALSPVGFSGSDVAVTLFVFIPIGVGALYLVAGDFHLASAGRVSASGPGRDAIEVLVGPGAQLPNAAPFYPSAPQFDWSSGTNNFAELELDPTSGEARIAWVDRHGRAFHRAAYRLS